MAIQYELPGLDTTSDPLHPFRFPSTRYQGSKRKLIGWIWENVRELSFDTVLDAFGGTGVVSYLFKRAGKQVTYNDLLKFNWNSGVALIENSRVSLSSDEVDLLLKPADSVAYTDFIQATFEGIYFTRQENAWLDHVIANIGTLLTNPHKQAIARFALFQACIIKRPYNLFHRANLYMRTADVKRSFGNKTTWDTPFEVHFRNFVDEANRAVFDNGRDHQALNMDVLDTPVGSDLVYLDPPYINANGVGVDYRDFYHFPEGMMDYRRWEQKVDHRSRHRRLKPVPSLWTRSDTILDAFDAVLSRHKDSIIVVSYRDNGIPSHEQLCDLLRAYKRTVYQAAQPTKYVLSKTKSHELLLIAV